MKHCSTSRLNSVFDLHLSAGRDLIAFADLAKWRGWEDNETLIYWVEDS